MDLSGAQVGAFLPKNNHYCLIFTYYYYQILRPNHFCREMGWDCGAGYIDMYFLPAIV